jgi:hypothetical protein
LAGYFTQSTASYARKQVSNYKKKSAKSAREFLTAIAHHLYTIYKFEPRFDYPTFGDVMRAAKFKNPNTILDHFSKANNQKNVDSGGDIRDFFGKDQWIYFLYLNSLVNEELQCSLTQGVGTTTIVFPSSEFQPMLVQDALEQIGFDATQFDIKNADSDSSEGGSPQKKVVTLSVTEAIPFR